MCKSTTKVYVKISADLSYTEQERWKWALIDSCISDLVDALQKGGIDMRGSCCGHGKDFGHIHLQDKRVLIITDDSFYQEFKWAFKVLLRAFRLRLNYYKRCLLILLIKYRRKI